MKRIVASSAIVITALVWLAAARPGAALLGADQTQRAWTGVISDSHCPAKVGQAAHKDCSTQCGPKDGGSVVLYDKTKKTHFVLQHKSLPTLAREHMGHEVTVKGEVDGVYIKVESIESAKGK